MQLQPNRQHFRHLPRMRHADPRKTKAIPRRELARKNCMTIICNKAHRKAQTARAAHRCFRAFVYMVAQFTLAGAILGCAATASPSEAEQPKPSPGVSSKTQTSKSVDD